MDRLLGWLSAHGGAVGLGLGLAAAGGAAYAVYRSRQSSEEASNHSTAATGSTSVILPAGSISSDRNSTPANLVAGGSARADSSAVLPAAGDQRTATVTTSAVGSRTGQAAAVDRNGGDTRPLSAALSALPLPPALSSAVNTAAGVLESAAQPVWAGITSVASSLTPSQVALLLVLCLAIVSVYAASLLLAVLPAASSSRAAPVGWALVGFAAATAQARSGGLGDAGAGAAVGAAGAPAIAVGGAGAPSASGAGAPAVALPVKASAAAPLPSSRPAAAAAAAPLSSSSATSAPVSSAAAAAVPVSSRSAPSAGTADAGPSTARAAADAAASAAGEGASASSASSAAEPSQAAMSTAAAEHEGTAAAAAAAVDGAASPPFVASNANAEEASSAVGAAAPVAAAAQAAAEGAAGRLFARLVAYVGAVDALDTKADAGTGSDVDHAHALATRALAAAQTLTGDASDAGASAALAALPELPAGTRTAPAHENEAAAARYARTYPPLPPVAAAHVAALRWRLARNRLLKGGAVASGKSGTAGAGAAKAGPEAVAASKPIFQEGLEHALAAIAAQETCADGHKFASILYAKAARDTKEQISFAYRIRDHGRRCLELRPDDSVAGLVLGTWCYEVAGLGWLMRQAAAALYGTPPTSTYEEALRYLHQSEDAATAPGGVGAMMSCRLKIAQSYWQLGRKDEAKRWTAAALALPVSPAEDPADVAALAALASKLGVKA